MKLTTRMRGTLIKKLSDSFTKQVSLEEFNRMFLFLDRWSSAYKITPYVIFEDKDMYAQLNRTDSGVVFRNWLLRKTDNIEKDFNKGRKLVRIFKDISKDYQDSLVYNLSANNILAIMVTVFFVDYKNTIVPFKFDVEDEERFIEGLDILRMYLAGVFFIDTLNDTIVIEDVFETFINQTEDELLDKLIEFGLIYR